MNSGHGGTHALGCADAKIAMCRVRVAKVVCASTRPGSSNVGLRIEVEFLG
jgi:hypothetical protein